MVRIKAFWSDRVLNNDSNTAAYLNHRNLNVIVVDWSKISNGLYVYASNMVVKVGKHIAEMIDFLETFGMSPKRTRLTGHSLGAHIAGLAGYYARVKPLYVVGKL